MNIGQLVGAAIGGVVAVAAGYGVHLGVEHWFGEEEIAPSQAPKKKPAKKGKKKPVQKPKKKPLKALKAELEKVVE